MKKRLFSAIAAVHLQANEEHEIEDQIMAIKKAQNFYDRILDGYGDDSIGELGGAFSDWAGVDDCGEKYWRLPDWRISLEKSTRYIYFDQKINGEYSFIGSRS